MFRIKNPSQLVKLIDLANKSNTPFVIGGIKHVVIDLNLTPKSSKSKPLLDFLAENGK